MATRSRLFVSHMSGIALAAFVVGSMPAHNHQAAANMLNANQTGAAAITSVDRHNQPLRVTKVVFDGIVPNIAHHY